MNERPATDRIKAELAAEIVRLIGEQKLADADVRARLGITDADFAHLRGGRTAWTSIEQLVGFLNVFDRHVDSKVDDGDHNPLEAIVAYAEQAASRIPPEELDRFPTDMAANIDHYLYGSPRRD